MMKRLVLTIFLVSSVAVFCQQSAQMDTATEVQAGDVLSFTVNLDKAPAFDDPAILVVVGPENGGSSAVQNTALAKDSKTEYVASIRIPVTAAEGRWRVQSVRLLVPAGRTVPLKINRTEFQVRKADVELPSAATIAIAK